MRYRLAIFDMDGTLADSFPWFTRVLNGVADRFGFRAVAPSEVAALRRCSPHELLARLAVPRWKLPLIARHMRRLKAEHLDTIPLFPGTGAMLETLAQEGVGLAIVSSDSEDNIRRALGARQAASIRYYACGAGLFGKPGKLRTVLRRAGVDPAEAIAIGDEMRDAEAARKVGTAFGAVAWGYADIAVLRAYAPDLVFERMEDIVPALLRPTAAQALGDQTPTPGPALSRTRR